MPQEGTIDLDLVLKLPDGTIIEETGGTPEDAPRSRLFLIGADAQAGAHSFTVRCKVCANMAYEVYVTTFSVGVPDEGFSALAE